MEKRKYKTKEELKEELEEKYPDFLYDAGINLIEKIDTIKEILENNELTDKIKIEKIKDIVIEKY